jgi:hypothetical protein
MGRHSGCAAARWLMALVSAAIEAATLGLKGRTLRARVSLLGLVPLTRDPRVLLGASPSTSSPWGVDLDDGSGSNFCAKDSTVRSQTFQKQYWMDTIKDTANRTVHVNPKISSSAAVLDVRSVRATARARPATIQGTGAFVFWGLKFRGVTLKRILSFRSIK